MRRFVAIGASVLLAFVCLCTNNIPVYAQLQANEVGIDISPERPGPYQSVTIRVSSFSADLSAAQVSWQVDGKTVLEGIGKTELAFTTKGTGSKTDITIRLVPPGQPSFVRTFSITPMGGDLLWEAVDSIVPPFYRGKALPASESQIRFVAMPDLRSSSGAQIPQDQVLYSWETNYSKNTAASGYGKSSYTIKANYLNKTELASVSMETRDRVFGANATVEVSTVDPKILWYALSPLYGPMFDLVLENGHSVSSSDIIMVAMPFFFSPKDPTSSKLTYEWTLNGDTLERPETANILSLHRDNSSAGEAAIGLSIKNLSTLFQEATSSLKLKLK